MKYERANFKETGTKIKSCTPSAKPKKTRKVVSLSMLGIELISIVVDDSPQGITR